MTTDLQARRTKHQKEVLTRLNAAFFENRNDDAIRILQCHETDIIKRATAAASVQAPIEGWQELAMDAVAELNNTARYFEVKWGDTADRIKAINDRVKAYRSQEAQGGNKNG